MSKDIRSYFSKAGGSSATKVKPTAESPPQAKKRTRRVIESDDEDDDSAFVKKSKEIQSPSKSESKPKKPEVIVQVESFFGSTPVSQKKQKIVPSKPKEKTTPKDEKGRKKKESKKIEVVELDDVTFENDEELESSYIQTDEEQLVKGLLSSGKKNSNKVPDNIKVEEKINGNKKSPRKENDKSKSPKKTPTPTPQKTSNKTPVKTPKEKEEKEMSTAESEKKKKSAEAYQKFLHRSGPKNRGSKEIPKGSPTCLQGLSFVITGVLDSLEREEAVEIIQKCGGRVVGQVSKKTDFVIVGEEPGASKLEKAEKFGTKKINEDELLNLIREKSDNDESEKDVVETTPEKSSKYFGKDKAKKRPKGDDKVEQVKAKIMKKEEEKKTPKKSDKKEDVKPKTEKDEKKVKEDMKKKAAQLLEESKSCVSTSQDLGSMEKTGGEMLWVDKYKPKSTKSIIGQMGDKSNVKKLIKWLENWHKNHSAKDGKKLSRPAPWAHNDDGSYFKAALLSGPPGVGKTTSVHLVCQELGFDIIEFNASDTRSKRLLQEEVTELLSSKSIRGFFQGNKESFQKHVLVMDEVDGMAGNEDRGGIQELIQLIKNTKVPIVGICNDRNHPKMRSLVNYCFDLRFQRPRVEQIKAAMKSICFKENIDISGEALEELIVNSNHDVRQVLHSLSMLASGDKALSYEEAKKKGEQAKKPLNLSPWDVARKVFSASEHEKMTLTDKTDLFFQDYSIGPLFVQDTYLRVKPIKAKNCEKKRLELISKTADSLILGDVVEKAIRSQNAWNLLPVQAIFSSVLPGHYMSGYVQGQITFPVWLGKNSRSNKLDRLLQELHSSLRVSASGSKESVNLDYLQHIRDSIVRPLVQDGPSGVQEALKFMLEYHLTREDLDNILELSQWPGMKDPFSGVDSKVKAALTRALNKECQLVSHSSKRPAKTKGDNEFDLEEGEDDVGEEEGDNIDLDPMIKKGKPKKAAKEEKEGKSSKKESSKKESSKKETSKKETNKKGKGKK